MYQNKKRNLGVLMDSQLDMTLHVNLICQTCYHNLRNIRTISKGLNYEATKSLVQVLVISRLDYCNLLLISISGKLISKLQRVQNAAV